MSRTDSSTVSTADDIINPMCPHYVKFDYRARKEIGERITSHLTKRDSVVRKLFARCIAKLRSLHVPLPCPIPSILICHETNEPILEYALQQMKIKINDWNGVQIDQCKVPINTWEKFKEKAKNHQDQTSWKVSGNDFFAHYIRQARPFFRNCCTGILDAEYRKVIIDFICLFFAVQLVNETIKFHRTKPKPLIRHRTWTRSIGIHNAMVELHCKLQLPKMIQNEKKQRKTIGKNNIIARHFHEKLVDLCQSLFNQQQRKLNQLIDHYDTPDNDNDDDDEDDDDNNTEMKIDEYVDDSYSVSSSSVISTASTVSTASSSMSSSKNNRKFQSMNGFDEGHCMDELRDQSRKNKRKQRNEYLMNKRELKHNNDGLIFDHSNNNNNEGGSGRITLLPHELSQQVNDLQIKNQKMSEELAAIHALLSGRHEPSKHSLSKPNVMMFEQQQQLLLPSPPQFHPMQMAIPMDLPQIPFDQIQQEYALNNNDIMMMDDMNMMNNDNGIAATVFDRDLSIRDMSIPPALFANDFTSCNNSVINSEFYNPTYDAMSAAMSVSHYNSDFNDTISMLEGVGPMLCESK